MTHSPTETIRVRLILVLALLSAVGPIALDLYLPSFPEVEVGLGATTAGVQLTLTTFLVGLGLGQLVWGPVSDRFGRFRPLLAGTLIAIGAGTAAVLAPTIEALVAARFVQALGSAAGVVIARAMIADLVQGFAAARALSIMMTIQAVAPIAAPVVGGAMAGHVSWRWVLSVVLLLTIMQLIGILTTIRETLPPARRALRLSYRSLGRLTRRPAFMAYALTQAFAFAAIMSYISNSSFVYQDVLGTSSLVYGLAFGLNAIGLMFGGAMSARLAKRFVHPATTIRIALPTLVVASALVLGAASTSTPRLLLLPLFVAVASVGFITGNCAALAVQQARDTAGSASAAIGGLMFLVGALLSPIGGLVANDSAIPMGLLMLSSAALSTGFFVVARRCVARTPDSEATFTR